MQATKIALSSKAALRGTALQQTAAARTAAAPARLAVQAATQLQTRKLKSKDAPKPPPPPPKRAQAGTVKIGGTRTVGSKTTAGTKSVGTKKVAAVGALSKDTVRQLHPCLVTAIEVFSKDRQFRQKQQDGRAAPKVLSRIEQLRLLSKLEQSGLLSQLERSGVTLSALEKSGALSAAEKLGALSLLGDRNFPGALYTVATALLVAGPAAVYFLPDDSAALVALQVVIALTCIAGGSAAWGGASLLSTLQKS